MTRLHHVEIVNSERSNRAEAKRRAIEERNRLAIIDALPAVAATDGSHVNGFEECR